jgi:predicted DNA-binding transcriptional regulator AlpA
MESWGPKKLLSVEEVAEALDMSVVTLNKWRCKRIGPPYFKLGASVRYRWGDVQAWLETQRV